MLKNKIKKNWLKKYKTKIWLKLTYQTRNLGYKTEIIL